MSKIKELLELRSFSREKAREFLTFLFSAETTDGDIKYALSEYYARGVSSEELLGFSDALLSFRVKVDLGPVRAIDLCGTGGDGKNTFNISTLAAFVVAGAGYPVVKHGNSSATSVSGASDVLQGLGLILRKDSDGLRRDFERAGICFIHAPFFQPRLQRVAAIRKELGFRTIFNLLGPLVNPARPAVQLMGVASSEFLPLYTNVLSLRKIDYVLVHSHEGYDEISLTGTFEVWSKNKSTVFKPGDLGFDVCDPASLVGGSTVREAVTLFEAILKGEGTKEQQSVVIVNAAMGIHAYDTSKNIAACILEATESLYSKKALAILNLLRTD
jgi:anthranilate phosphoribosyltransferase